MHKYLAVLENRRGQWTTGPLTQAYVFEEVDDKAATGTLAAYLSDKPGYAVTLLYRILCGPLGQEINFPNDVRSSEKLSFQREQEIGWSMLLPGKMTSQLQAFDPKERKNRLAAIKRLREKDIASKAKVKSMGLPKVGEDIYVQTALHLSHGHDDVVGGLARVKSVSLGMSAGKQVHFVSVEEIPGRFNWEQHLALEQDALKKRFGKSRAHRDPDDDPEFNEP